MANPAVNFLETTFVFTELADTFGSAFLHEDTLAGTIADDNAPTYDTTFTYIPDPANLPGFIFVFISGVFTSPPGTYDGDIDVDYEVEDNEIDFLREGMTVTQDIDVTITDTSTGESTTETFTIEITGANDVPTAIVDRQTVSENAAFIVNRVVGNDTDPDIGDTLALTPAGFKVKSVSNTGKEQFLTRDMVKIEQINLATPDNPLAAKDAIKVELAQAFQGLMKGDKATIVIEYGISDDFGGLSGSTFTITVNGDTDKTLVGTKADNRYLIGEADKDEIFGLKGDDVIDGRGGNDILFGGPGADVLKGGKGKDTASYETSKKGVTANLLKPGKNKGEAAGDTYKSVENLTGTNKADNLTGNKGGNVIKGLGGNDKLVGGKGKDILEGGIGADKINGGKDADTIVFSRVEDSLATRKFMDVISGFKRKEKDKFDLRGIDAKSKSKKNDKFKFIGDDAFSGKAGELRYEKVGKATFVYGDTDGNGFQDFGFKINGKIDLKADDFML